ncbi:hypothetical protein [Nocardia niigatensis]|uniref:hypothetical protein n=1 Tax=Nocardia niigatensis TaxID=209249 RepID=UPI0012F656D3|nr:hypothetical protein [Nocardia niigatensis]
MTSARAEGRPAKVPASGVDLRVPDAGPGEQAMEVPIAQSPRIDPIERSTAHDREIDSSAVDLRSGRFAIPGGGPVGHEHGDRAVGPAGEGELGADRGGGGQIQFDAAKGLLTTP